MLAVLGHPMTVGNDKLSRQRARPRRDTRFARTSSNYLSCRPLAQGALSGPSREARQDPFVDLILRKTASYFPRPRLRSQTTMSMMAPLLTVAARHRALPRGVSSWGTMQSGLADWPARRCGNLLSSHSGPRTWIGSNAQRAGSSSLPQQYCHFELQRGPAPNIAHSFVSCSESPSAQRWDEVDIAISGGVLRV